MSREFTFESADTLPKSGGCRGKPGLKNRLQLLEAGVAEALGKADQARWMRSAFGRNRIDRFERHHIWILRQESRDLLKSGRQLWIFAGNQIDDPLVVLWDC